MPIKAASPVVRDEAPSFPSWRILTWIPVVNDPRLFNIYTGWNYSVKRCGRMRIPSSTVIRKSRNGLPSLAPHPKSLASGKADLREPRPRGNEVRRGDCGTGTLEDDKNRPRPNVTTSIVPNLEPTKVASLLVGPTNQPI